MTTDELKAAFEVACRDCKGRERCMVPSCQGLADEITTAIEGEVAERIAKAEELGPLLLIALKRVMVWVHLHATALNPISDSVVEEADTAISKAEGRE